MKSDQAKLANLPVGWLPLALYQGMIQVYEAINQTSQQMKAAPMRAVYICANSEHEHVEYAKKLAKHVGREDLEIWPPSMLDDQKNVIRSFTGVVLDHAAMLTSKQVYSLVAARAKVRAPEQWCCEKGRAQNVEVCSECNELFGNIPE